MKNFFTKKGDPAKKPSYFTVSFFHFLLAFVIIIAVSFGILLFLGS